MEHRLTCEHCDGAFTATRSDARYGDDTCRKRALRGLAPCPPRQHVPANTREINLQSDTGRVAWLAIDATRCWFRLNWPFPDPNRAGLSGRALQEETAAYIRSLTPRDPRHDAHEWSPGLYWIGRTKVEALRRHLRQCGAKIIDTDFGGPFAHVVAAGTTVALEQSLLTVLDAIPDDQRQRVLRTLEAAVHPDRGELPPAGKQLRELIQAFRRKEA
jgi:hypothetical protein